MTTQLTPLDPRVVAERLRRGEVVLVDIREPDEFAREHIAGAVAAPLSRFEAAHLKLEPGRDVVFHCRSGGRTSSACDRLAGAADGPAFVLEGGLEAWKRQKLPVVADRRRPIEVMRQVQITAGSLVLAGVVLGVFVHPAFLGLSAFVGAGLAFAGASGWCGMARLLQVMPWNRQPV
jgi:rhodanese-related sulfurtransferase